MLVLGFDFVEPLTKGGANAVLHGDRTDRPAHRSVRRLPGAAYGDLLVILLIQLAELRHPCEVILGVLQHRAGRAVEEIAASNRDDDSKDQDDEATDEEFFHSSGRLPRSAAYGPQPTVAGSHEVPGSGY